MRINIAILDGDKNYTARLVNGLQTNYQKEVSVKAFSDVELFKTELLSQFFHVAILDQEYLDIQEEIPEKTVAAVFVKDNEITEIDKVPAVGKYQRVDNIYKRIVGIYADHSSEVTVGKKGIHTNTILVTSVQGGAGVSSIAAAYAVNMAQRGKNVFYLNLENFGNANTYFQGEGQGSFSDVIYALKSNNINLPLKLQSTIKKDYSGVYFIDGCRNAFDMLEVTDAEIGDLLEGIVSVQDFDAIIIDYSGAFTSRQQLLMKEYADSILYITDGSDVGNDKFKKFCEAVRIIEKKENCAILNKMSFAYNRYSSKTSSQMERVPVAMLGGVARIEGVSGRALVDELAKKDTIYNG